MKKTAAVSPPPSPDELLAARVRLNMTLSGLLEDDPSMAEDTVLLTDMLDGEGGNALDVLRAALAAGFEARMIAAGAKNRADAIKARQARMEARADRIFKCVAQILRDLRLPYLEGDEGRLTLRDGSRRTVILDATKIPPSFLRAVQPEPDIAKIKQSLTAGLDVPGATLETGPDTFSLKV